MATPRLAAVPVSRPAAAVVPPVCSGPLPRRLVAVPDLACEAPEDSHLPVVTLDVLPAPVPAGGDAELLVMAANAQATTLPEIWVGVVLPIGAQVSSVTPPAGTVAVTERSGSRAVVRARIAELTPGSCVGLDVSLIVPAGEGPHRVTAFVTPCTEAEFTLTCEQVLQVAPDSRSDGSEI